MYFIKTYLDQSSHLYVLKANMTLNNRFRWMFTYNIYLFSSCPSVHKASIGRRYNCLSGALFSISLQVFPMSFISNSSILRYVSFGRPLFRFPLGVHLSAILVISSPSSFWENISNLTSPPSFYLYIHTALLGLKV